MKKALLPLLATASISQLALAEVEKPNIVFLLIDDLGWGELEPYGNTFNETPNINQMASEGVTFTNAYASSAVSSPTRACYYTGQYSPRHGVCDFLPENTKQYLDPAKHVTINEALKNAGYYTGMIGKWHLDTDFTENKGGPDKHGYDWVFGTETSYIAGGDYFYPYDKISTITTGVQNEFLTDRLCNEAIGFIEEHKDEPFFLSVQLYSVHMTVEAPTNLVTKYKNKYDAKYGAGASDYFETSSPKHGGLPDNPYLAGMIEKIDDNVGKIIQKFKDFGIDDKTIFIVTSDNGGDIPVGNNGGLRQCKTWLYEGGIRVPLIIRYPGVCDKNITSDVPVNTIDFYPTFLELADNATTTQLLDGTSIAPLFKENGTLARDEMYWYYPAGNSEWNARKACVVRKGDFKLIYRFALAPDRYELYNLKNDPFETTNLANSNLAKFNELKGLLDNWMVEMNLPKWQAGAETSIFDFETEFPLTWGTNGNPTNNMHNEDHVNFTIADNPDKSGINESDKVGKFRKLQNGLWWAYAWFNFPDTYIAASNEKTQYLHVMVRKPLKSTVCVQLVGYNNASTDEIQKTNKKENEWEDMVFEITHPNFYNSVQFKADFVNTSGHLTEDLDIYFDDIIVNDDPTPRGGTLEEDNRSYKIADFESGFFGTWGTNANDGINGVKEDHETFLIVDNPLKNDVNNSEKVALFERRQGGLWWAYAWFTFDNILVEETPRYLHVMVNKPLVSTICAQMKDRHASPSSNTGEIKSNAQTKTNEWEDIVFTIDKTGNYSYFEFKPDFVNPSSATSDIDIYFDDIVLNNDPAPRGKITGTGNKNITFSGIQVFPMATSGIINIVNETLQTIKISIYDLNGSIMKEELLSGTHKYLNIASFATGLYILNASNTEMNQNFKIVKI